MFYSASFLSFCFFFFSHCKRTTDFKTVSNANRDFSISLPNIFLFCIAPSFLEFNILNKDEKRLCSYERNETNDLISLFLWEQKKKKKTRMEFGQNNMRKIKINSFHCVSVENPNINISWVEKWSYCYWECLLLFFLCQWKVWVSHVEFFQLIYPPIYSNWLHI